MKLSNSFLIGVADRPCPELSALRCGQGHAGVPYQSSFQCSPGRSAVVAAGWAAGPSAGEGGVQSLVGVT